MDIASGSNQSNECAICSAVGDDSCARCGNSYCAKHARGKEESRLVSIEQHLGTCVLCGAIICEQCWIFNNDGFVTCLGHLESQNND